MSPNVPNVPYTPSPLCPHTPSHTHMETKGTSIYRDSDTPSKLKQSTDDPAVATGRIELNACITSDPDVLAFARACRDRFGPGVKLYADRYGHLWGQP